MNRVTGTGYRQDLRQDGDRDGVIRRKKLNDEASRIGIRCREIAFREEP